LFRASPYHRGKEYRALGEAMEIKGLGDVRLKLDAENITFSHS
jgi:hypothetical protein